MKIGDIVKLKSGGPRMTVVFVHTHTDLQERPFFGSPHVLCGWFDSEHAYQERRFPVNILDSVINGDDELPPFNPEVLRRRTGDPRTDATPRLQITRRSSLCDALRKALRPFSQ